MALSRLSLAFSLLLLSLVVIAFAGDYGDDSSKYGFDGIPADSPQAKPEGEEKRHYDTKPDYYKPKPLDEEKPDFGDGSSKYGFDGIPADSPQAKPEGEEKPHYGTKPKPVDEEKPDFVDDSSKYGFDGIPADSPQPKPEEEEKPNYEKKQYIYKPKPEQKEKPGYDRKPYVVKPKPEGEGKSNYGTKQDIYKPKSEEKEKPDYDKKSYVVKPKEEEKHYYGAKPDIYKAKPEEKPDYNTKQYLHKPKTEQKEKPEYGRKQYVVKPEPKGEKKPYYGTKPEEKENLLSIGVQGLVLCQSGSKYYPIQGALAKIICKAVDVVGVEKTISTCSGATDAKGYFFATVSHLDKLKLKECKAYLQSSPLKTCNAPTNVNKAIDGALFSAFRVLNDKKIKLYSVGPFFYTSEAKPAPKYGY